MFVSQNYLYSVFIKNDVQVVDYQMLFKNHYMEIKFDYEDVVAWAKLVNEFGVVPANANWCSLLDKLPDNNDI